MGKVRESEERYEKNEDSLRKHEESYEAEQIQLSGNATFLITFLTLR